MPLRLPSQLAPRSWLRLRLPARTARLRLTLLYGALFLGSGAGLLAITYLLVSHSGNALYFKVPGTHLHAIQVRAVDVTAKITGHLTAGASRQFGRAHAEGEAQRASDLHHLLIWSVVALLIMAVVSVALGWYVAGRVLTPLRTITTTARAITARNLQERLSLDGPDDEFKALGDTLDDLLARLHTAFEAQQHFVANAAHELRTPLAWEQTLLQVALADADASNGELRAACTKVLAASKQQQGLVEALLTLATTERGLDHLEPIDLSVLTDAVLLAPYPDAERRDVEITAAIEPAPTSGHPGLVERLIANLLDNAVRYNVPGGHVHVQTTTTADGRARLLVANTGPEIPPTEIERLFEPFQRLETTRTNRQGGYGLGLSIVKAVATAHDADLTIRPQADGGLVVEVSFPSRRAQPHRDLGDRPRSEPDTRRPEAMVVSRSAR